MILRDASFERPADNILYDEVLLQAAEDGRGGPFLRLWESSSVFVVLGRIGRLAEDVDGEAVRRDRVPVLRRFSGGGTVVQGPGCLNYALVVSRQDDPRLGDLRRSYRVLLDEVAVALRRAGVEARFHPPCDLALAETEKKISGNAQHRGRRFILHHGTVLYRFDLPLISRYLKMPCRMPDYRRGRGHGDFVANVPATGEALRAAFTDHFAADGERMGATPEELSRLEEFRAVRPVAVEVPRR